MHTCTCIHLSSQSMSFAWCIQFIYIMITINMYEPVNHFLNYLGFILCRSFPSLVFPAQRVSFSICGKAGLVVLNSLNFCLSGKLLISPPNLKDSLAGQSILGCRFFPFITWNISRHSIPAYRISVEKSADNLKGVPLYVMCHFFLVAFIFYLCL